MRGIIATTNEGYTIIEAAYIDTNHGYVIGKSKIITSHGISVKEGTKSTSTTGIISG